MKLLFLTGSLIAGLVSAQDGYFALCSTDSNCGANGTCVIDQCQCAIGFRSIIGQSPCSISDSVCNSTVIVNTECNKIGNGGVCQAPGVCSCNTNFIDGAGQCSVSMSCQSSSNNNQCGNGICQGSSCICNSGWYSLTSPCDTKSTPCVSDAYCGHGTCDMTTGQCVCGANWTAEKSLLCDGCLNDSACGNGRCDGLNTGVCTCNTGWVKGSDHVCNVVDTSCTQNANCGNGKCTNHMCVCNPTYGSVATPCDKVTGDCGSAGFGSYCEHGGVCILTSNYNPTCTCTSGYYGDRCESVDFCYGNPCQSVNETCVTNANRTAAECLNTGDICPTCDSAFAVKLSLFMVALMMMF